MAESQHGAAPAREPQTAQQSPGGMPENTAGLLAYITFIPAIVFLAVEPYNKSRFIRFHAFQSIFLTIAWVAVWAGLMVLGVVPVLNLLLLVISPFVGLAFLGVWILCLVKAAQGATFKLPVIGELAEKQANG